MAWIKIDDQFRDHPKVLAAGPLACWLYVCGLTFAGQYLTDGHIPTTMLRKLADVDNAKELADRLVSVGLWEEIEGGYRILDWLNCSIMPDRSTQEERKYREYKAWRLAVIRRDEHACQQCGYDGGADHSLHVHHRLPWAAFRRHRFDVDNGLTLCAECHKAVHREAREHGLVKD